MRLEPLEETGTLSLEEFRRGPFARRRPVVLRGAVRHWAALGLWTDAYLKKHIGALEAEAYVMPKGRIRIDRAAGFELRRMSVRAFLDDPGRADGERYVFRTSFDGRFGALTADLSAPVYCAERSDLRRNFWMARAGVITQLHFDLPDNVIAMVRGRKRFFVFPPSARDELAPMPWFSSTPPLARLDPESLEAMVGPLGRGVRGHRVDLDAGDLLYLPPRFYHHARALEDCVSLNHWWCRPPTRALLAASDAYKRIRGLVI